MKKHILIIAVFILSLSIAFGAEKQDAPPRLNVNGTMIKNFFKSLILPGWGQWENGNKVRAIVYATAEIGAIYGYQYNYTEGEDLEKNFKDFGDKYWAWSRWTPENDIDATCGSNLRTHQMPVVRDRQGNPVVVDGYYVPLKDHHFYENIGKYSEFSCGWEDFYTGAYMNAYDDDETTLRAEYINMRTRSNELYRNAQVAGTLIMVNHLISAFDAALGTDMTSFETPNMTGKLYINPLNTMSGIRMEVKF